MSKKSEHNREDIRIKIGNMNRIRVIGWVIALLAPVVMMAQEPRIRVNARSQVTVGERFNVAFELNADGKDFRAPTFEGFQVVGGPMNSTSSSVQIVNGSMSRSVSNTYTYVLRADNEGNFTIGPASITVNGQVVSSEPYSISVSGGGGGTASSGQGGQQSSSGGRAGTSDPQVDGQDLFVKAIPSKRSA